MRRQFTLPEGDETHLKACGLDWETIIEGGVRWILLHGFAVPGGYSQRTATAAVRMETGYPDTQLDMVYFHPGLARTDARAVGALTTQVLDGKTFQRWSRHRTSQNPWRPGEDDLASHLALVEHWLEREISSR
jgi:hypothetical protein